MEAPSPVTQHGLLFSASQSHIAGSRRFSSAHSTPLYPKAQIPLPDRFHTLYDMASECLQRYIGAITCSTHGLCSQLIYVIEVCAFSSTLPRLLPVP